MVPSGRHGTMLLAQVILCRSLERRRGTGWLRVLVNSRCAHCRFLLKPHRPGSDFMDDPSTDPQLEQLKAASRGRREARRAAQRLENVTRAKMMHAARLDYDVHFEASRPPTGPLASRVREPRGVYIGCSGWYYRHWANAFYPEGLSSSRWFEHYASNFGTVELNAPFYSWPTTKTVSVWKRQPGNREFVYSIKVNELITHIKRFVRTDTLVRDFGLVADLLGSRFGCFLFQLPPSFQ